MKKKKQGIQEKSLKCTKPCVYKQVCGFCGVHKCSQDHNSIGHLNGVLKQDGQVVLLKMLVHAETLALQHAGSENFLQPEV